MQGVQRYVVFAYVVIAWLLWMTLSKLLQAAAFVVNAPDPEILGNQFTLTTALSLIIAGAASWFAFKNERVYGFSAEVVAELKKVTWPSKLETKTATTVVIVTTLVLSVVLFVFDQLWGALTGVLY